MLNRIAYKSLQTESAFRTERHQFYALGLATKLVLR